MDDDDDDIATWEVKTLLEAIDQLHNQITSSYHKKTTDLPTPATDDSQYCAVATSTNSTKKNFEYCNHFYNSCNYEEDCIDNEATRKNKVVDILDSIANLLLLFPDNSDLENHSNHHETEQRLGQKQRQQEERYRLRDSAVDRAKHEIRNGFGLLLANVGYANVQLLLHWILATLPALSNSASARELLLEFLPCCLPPTKGVQNNNNKPITSSSSVDTDITSYSHYHYHIEERIVSTLCSIVREDSSTQSLLPILTFFSKTNKSFTTTTSTIKVVHFCIQSMSLVSVKDLPLLCKTMFHYLSSLDFHDGDGDSDTAGDASIPSYKRKRDVDNEGKVEEEEEHEDADDTILKGLEAIRQELKTIPNNCCSIDYANCFGVGEGLGDRGARGTKNNELDDGENESFAVQEDVGQILIPFLLNSPRMARGYKRILERHFGGRIGKTGEDQGYKKNRNIHVEMDREQQYKRSYDKGKATIKKERAEDWILVDGIALLILFHCHPIHRTEMEQMLYSLCCWSIFPFSILLHIAAIIQKRCTDGSSRNSIGDNIQDNNSSREESMLYSLSTTSTILLPALIEMGLHLILTPIRHSDHASYHKELFRPQERRTGAIPLTTTVEKPDLTSRFFEQHGTHGILSQTHDFIVDLYQKLPDEVLRGELISSLLALSSPTNFIQTLISAVVTTDKKHVNPLDRHSSHEMASPRNNPRKRQQVAASKSYTTFSNVKFSNKMIDSMPHRLQRLLRPPQCSGQCKYQLRDVYDIAMASLWTMRLIIHSCCQQQQNEHTNKDEIRRRYKHIFVDRLCQFAASSSSTFTHMEGRCSTSFVHEELADKNENNLRGKNECEKYDFSLAELYCSILVSLVYDDNDNGHYTPNGEHLSTTDRSYMGGGRDTGMELMILVQKLIFTSSMHTTSVNHPSSSSCITGTGAQDGHLGNRNLPVGFILAKHLVHSPRVSSVDRDGIVKWVLRTLTPAIVPKKDCAMNNASVDPVAGYWGINFLYSLCPDLEGQHSSETNTRDLLFQTRATNSLLTEQYPLSEVFKHIKSIVSRSGLVQLESKVHKDKEQRKKRNEVDAELDDVFAYDKVPSCFDPHGDSMANPGGRRIVICVASFLRSMSDSDGQSGTPDGYCCNNAAEWMRYVHCLISTYLKMGRLMSKRWSSKGWLLAKIELPRLSIGNENKSEIIEIELGLDSTERCCGEREELQVEYSSIASFISRTKAYIVSIGFLTAVLENAFDHYEQSRMAGEKEHSFNLIQFQLAKIYCLRDRCTITLDKLATVYQQERRPSRKAQKDSQIDKGYRGKCNEIVEHTFMHDDHYVPTSAGDNTYSMDHLAIIVQKLRIIVPTFFREVSHVFICILWSCLRSLKNDRIMKESNIKITLQTGSSYNSHVSKHNQSSWSNLCELLKFQISVLRHLNVISCSINTDIDWVCEERQRRRYYTKEKEKEQHHSGFLQNFLNTNGMEGIVDSIWTTIPWLSHLGKACQSNETRSSRHGLVKSEVLLFSQVREFVMSAFSLIHNTMEISVFLQSVFGHQQMKLLQILHENKQLNATFDAHTDDPTVENVCFQIIDKISLCEDSVIACRMLDLLSILSIQEKDAIPSVHNANWVIFLSDYNVMEYDNYKEIISLDDRNFTNLPHAFVHSVLTHLEHFTDCNAPHESIALQQVLLNLLKCGTKALHEFKDCSTLCYNLLSHWGIARGIGSEFCQEIQQLVLALEATVNLFIGNTKKALKPKDKYNLPRVIIPSLDGGSYPMAFELVLYQIVASLLLSHPQFTTTSISDDDAKAGKSLKPTDDESTPYREILDFIIAFDSTLHIFSTNMHLFPNHFTLVTMNACLLMVKTCEYQVENCIRWHSTHVPPRAINRRIKNSDNTSVHFLKSLLNCMRLNCAESIIEFCGKFAHVDKTSTSITIADVPTNVRRAATQLVVRSEKLLCTLHSTSATYNLLLPSLECLGGTGLMSLDSDETLNKRMVQKRKINFHVNHQCNSDVQELKSCQETPAEYDGESSEEDSFQVTGSWGYDSSNGDDSRSEGSSSLSLEITS